MEIDVITLGLSYPYKGCTNGFVQLVKYPKGQVDVVNDYGEVMTTFEDAFGSGHWLWQFLRDLEEGKYA